MEINFGNILEIPAFFVALAETLKPKEKLEDTDEICNWINSEINSFYFDCSGKYITRETEKQIQDFYNKIYTELSKYRIPKTHRLFDKINTFKNDFKQLPAYIEKTNNHYFENENSKYDWLLSNVDGRFLDKQQRNAVLCDEDNILVVAGAGSGKTLTISGKVKYLCEAKGIKPEDILLIAFTNKSVQEMNERINKRMGYAIETTTFHKLGLEILKSASDKNYDIKDDMRQFVENYFEKKTEEDKTIVKDLVEFFAYYLQLPADLNNYDSLGDTYEHEKSMDLETIRSKYNVSSYTQKQKEELLKTKKTLKNETVKSLQELEIANFLFLHGVNYEYEKVYPYQPEGNFRRMYKPDFYLPDYDIYLEHFGINENGRCPWLNEIEEIKYIDDMNWKRQFHKEKNTKLLETYSWYCSNGILLEKLEELLKRNGVRFKEVDLADVFNAVYKKHGKKYFSQFITLCCTFITLFKSNDYKLNDLDKLMFKNDLYNNPFHRCRIRVFKGIIAPIINEYENELNKENAYDFSDMINLSSKLVREGFKIHPYKYIIIDEFQDISVARYRLIKAILEQTNAKLMCVGDDWQSIYRFAGSDISLFTDFEAYFGYGKTLKIENTYRNSQQLINVAGSFIMANEKQIKKRLFSEKKIDKPIRIHFFNEYCDDELKNILDEIIKENGKEKSIMLLGRTNYDFDIVKESGLFYGNSAEELHYKNSKDTPISFLTIHKAKGMEADNVILLNFENSLMGFPNKIVDDPLLELVLSRSDNYFYAEERRLFYVAMTRTKNRFYILANNSNPSQFLNELPESEDVLYVGRKFTQNDEAQPCPRCKIGRLVKRKGENGKWFVGCSNYPKCDYTVSSTEAVKNARRCPLCDGYMILKFGKYGAFYACSNYPHCNYKEKFEEIKICPECQREMKVRNGKNGLFWGCSGYPECKHTENIEP